MSTGLIALLDDVVGLTKVAAAALDDAAGQAAKAGVKAAGVVVDDAAVTPRYAVGFAAERELPIIARIAVGSLKNKLLILLPAALVLSLVAPFAITPLLMLGGAYLCYEGAEKVYEIVHPHGAHEKPAAAAPADAKAFEDERVRGAIQTDFILSAEIMAITLSSVAEGSFWTQAVVLALVGVGITALVYGAVALIVKADDAGVALARHPRPVSGLLGSGTTGEPTGTDRAFRPATQALGRGLVVGMPVFLQILSAVGTAAMLWVGGGILVHGLAELGVAAPEHWLHEASEAAARRVPAMAAAVAWAVTAAGSGLVGLALGALLIPVATYAIAPAAAALTRRGPRGPAH